METKKILSIGNICVDIKSYCSNDDETEAYRPGSIELVPGGVARGMAINLKHLGFDTSIYSYVGNDIFGDFLKKGLDNENVNTDLLRRSNEHETALFSVMAPAGKSATCVYSTNILKEISFDKDVLAYIKKENINVISMDSNLNPETYAEIYAYKKANPDVFIFQNATAPDIASKSVPYADLVDLFGCNEFEAAALIGEEAIPDITTADKLQSLGYKNFIITFGERGVLVRYDNQTWIEAAYKTPGVVDTIGAGDAFASGFLMGFLEKADIKRCIHFGLACAKETLMTKQTISSLLSREFLENYKA